MIASDQVIGVSGITDEREQSDVDIENPAPVLRQWRQPGIRYRYQSYLK